MILSASRRTDIPAFYSQWLVNRLKAGYVLARNPMCRTRVSRIPLSPEIVDCIVFWTKDPRNMMDKLSVLDELGYSYYFQFTLTPYGPELERNLRPKAELENTFLELSHRLGSGRVLWRYDPVILNSGLTVDYHKEQFYRLCQRLQGATEQVTFSFVDLYAKLRSDQLRAITVPEMEDLAAFFAQTARDYGMRPCACCEKLDFTSLGVEPAACIDPKAVSRACGRLISVPKDKNQREGCGCCESVDLGAYDTCANGCVYCYANRSPAVVMRNRALHRQDGELLIGELSQEDMVTQRKNRAVRKG